MHEKIAIALLWGAAAGWAAPATAENIYRCGDSYSQQPCAGGRLVAASDARSAEQRSQTSRAAERDARAASLMEQSRLKEEAKPAQVLLPPPKPEEAAPLERKTVIEAAARKPAHFTAVSRKAADGPKPKKKAKKKSPPGRA